MTGKTHEYDVFLSFRWVDIVDVEPLEEAMRRAGLSVFRDSRCIDEFDGISGELIEALASSKVLLAYYSASFPNSAACQWELTTAFVAAQRHGDPCRRVLAVNPEPDARHLAPVQLVDARYFVRPGSDAERARLVACVRDRVLAADGPLGPAPARADAGVPHRIHRPVRFVGRFPQLWQVHSLLHANDFPASTEPTRCAVAVVRGLAGTGKTSLAEQYGFLFRDAFPGGVYWTGPLDARPDPLAGPEIVAQFYTQLRELAASRLGLRLTGAAHDRVRAVIADHFDRVRRPALLIVDDVPSGPDPALLDQLLIPSPFVRTLLTSRGGTATWDAPVIDIGGLTPAEGRALFAGVRALSGDAEQRAVAELVDRAGGHPLAIRLVAESLRNTQGLVSGAEFVRRLRAAGASVADVVTGGLPTLGDAARRTLRLATVLATAPFPLTLAAEVLGPALAARGDEAGALIGAGVTELVDRGLAQAVDGGASVHPLVADAVRANDSRDDDTTGLAAAAAGVVLRMFHHGRPEQDGEAWPAHLCLHARTLAGQAGVSPDQRLRLLRAVVHWHTEQGEFTVAGTVVDEILHTGPDSIRDLLTAAKVEIAGGHYDKAARHGRHAADLAAATGNERAGYRALLLAARALDHLGQYVAADELFWQDRYGGRPAWMSADEWRDCQIVRVTGLRLRGQLKAALELAESLLADLGAADRRDPATEPALTATLEVARLRLQTGQIIHARQAATDVVSACVAAGLRDHPKCLEAAGIHAEAQLVLDLTEMRVHMDELERAERELRVLHEKYRTTMGADNPVTLAAAVRRDRALVALGRPRTALAALAETESAVVSALGAHHPLLGQVRYAMSQCHGQLRDFQRSKEILTDLLSVRVATLGARHPDTLTTMLDLGIDLILLGERRRGKELVDEASRNLGSEVDWKAEVRLRGYVTQGLALLPKGVLDLAMTLDRLLSKQKDQ